jgi:hypothetical protein
MDLNIVRPALIVDSLLRASALCPVNTEFFLVNNTGDPATLADFSPKLARPLSILPVSGAPRPYFEIARTVFDALSRVAPAAPEWCFLIYFSSISCTLRVKPTLLPRTQFTSLWLTIFGVCSILR